MITVNFNDESLLLDDGATVSCMLGKKSISAVNIAVAVHDGDTVLVIKAFYGG